MHKVGPFGSTLCAIYTYIKMNEFNQVYSDSIKCPLPPKYSATVVEEDDENEDQEQTPL